MSIEFLSQSVDSGVCFIDFGDHKHVLEQLVVTLLEDLLGIVHEDPLVLSALLVHLLVLVDFAFEVNLIHQLHVGYLLL